MKFVLLTQVDGRLRVWRPRNTAFLQEHIVCTTAFGGAGVTVWGCFSLNYKLFMDEHNIAQATKKDQVFFQR
jgi:hypothetical protein